MGALPNPSEWRKLPISLCELCLNTTLRCGQSFRWRKAPDTGIWSIALYNRILSLHQDAQYLYYRSLPPPRQIPLTPPPSADEDDDTLDLIKHYLNLSPNLTALYAQWSASDPHFARTAPAFTGVRILQQPAWEALVGFICSSNNNIIRISQMVHKLCIRYGPRIGVLEDGDVYHDFPTPQALAQEGVESELRKLGFGYRARYLATTAKAVSRHSPGWLEALRNPLKPAFASHVPPDSDVEPFVHTGRLGFHAAREALLTLTGVGPKVADCVCLMGLGWGESVPVDTHVWQIAVRDYKMGGRGAKDKAMTKEQYVAVGDKFRALWGQEAGWAHSVLFTADLRAFKSEVKAEVKEEEAVVVKKEEEEEDAVGGAVLVAKTTVKRELDEEADAKMLTVTETIVRKKPKRRRKA